MDWKEIANENPDIIKFLKEYNNLCKKYNMGLQGCGCCGSPALVGYKINGDIEDVNYDESKNVVYITGSGETIDGLIKSLEE